VTEPTKVYAVVWGEYSDYTVHVIYRRREDAKRAIERAKMAPRWLVDGEFATSDHDALPTITIDYPQGARTITDWNRVEEHPDRMGIDVEAYGLDVDEFDYYEGEPVPAEIVEVSS
jgi:hypothetical protein